MANSFTAFFGFKKPARGDHNWSDEINDNLDVIDATLQAHEEALAAGKVQLRVRAVMTANVSLTVPGSTFDTVTFTNPGEDRVLLTGQTAPAENGLWTWTGGSSALVRTSDADTSYEVKAGQLVTVTEGSANNVDSIWELTTDDPIVLGTTGLTFVMKVGPGMGFAQQSALTAEASTRATADSTLTTAIASEATARANADTTLTTALSTEATTARAAESANAAAIDTFKPGSDQWLKVSALAQAFLLTSAPPTYDSEFGTITASNITWSDAVSGVYTATLDANGAVTSFTATHVGPTTRTVTVTIPRNSESQINAAMTAAVA